MDGTIQGLEVLSPMQAALLRGFARKRLAEQEGTYKPLMGDPEENLDDADEWSAPPHMCLHLTYSPLLSLFPFHCHHPCAPPVYAPCPVCALNSRALPVPRCKRMRGS